MYHLLPAGGGRLGVAAVGRWWGSGVYILHAYTFGYKCTGSFLFHQMGVRPVLTGVIAIPVHYYT